MSMRHFAHINKRYIKVTLPKSGCNFYMLAGLFLLAYIMAFDHSLETHLIDDRSTKVSEITFWQMITIFTVALLKLFHKLNGAV